MQTNIFAETKELILIEENEYALYKILKNLNKTVKPILADIRDIKN